MARTTYLWTFLFAVVLLAASGWTYRELLYSVFGPFDATGAPVVRAFDDGGRIALLDSRTTARVHASRSEDGLNPAWFENNLDTWRAFLTNIGADFVELTDADVESGRLSDYDLLILPSTTALTDYQIERVKAFLHEGRSVFATWMPGVYREDGSWRGYSFIEETFGVQADAFGADAFSNFRVYTDTFPGLAEPGLYRPIRRSAEEAEEEAPVAGSPFTPLSGFSWAGPLGSERPAADFALADTLTRSTYRGGEYRREAATRVRYYTWLGGDAAAAAEAAGADTPFQRVTFVGGTPLAANIPAAFRMKTGTYDAPLSVRVAEPRTRAAAFRYDFAASDLPAQDALDGSAAVVYGTYGNGRFIYMGHELSAMGFDPTEQGVLARIFENTLRWLGRAPISWVGTWPAPYDRAAVVTVLPADGTSPEGLLATLRDADAAATVFVDPGDRDAAARLGRRTELGVLGDASLPTATLSGHRERLEAAAGAPVTAFRPLHRGSLTLRAADALVEAGFTHAFPDTLGRAFDPTLMGGHRLAVIPRTARTDHDILRRTPAGSAEARLDLIRSDLDRVTAERGLYTLTLHADGFGRAEHLPVLRQTLADLRARGFWTPTGSELAEWVRSRHGLQTYVAQRGPRRIHVRVSNERGSGALDVAIQVALGQAVAEVSVRPELVGTPDPAVSLNDDATILTLRLDDLAPGQYRTYQVDFVPLLPGEALAQAAR